MKFRTYTRNICCKSRRRCLMKKSLILVLVLLGFATQIFADNFTDAIQDLAIQTACIGKYNSAETDGGWTGPSSNYYDEEMMAVRFAVMSGDKTKTNTFFGVCFNYAEFAWSDINKYKAWYNEQGLYEGQFWVAGVQDNPDQIELMSIGNKNDYSRIANGEYIKTYSTSLRNVKTHKKLDGTRATCHAWIWKSHHPSSDGMIV